MKALFFILVRNIFSMPDAVDTIDIRTLLSEKECIILVEKLKDKPILNRRDNKVFPYRANFKVSALKSKEFVFCSLPITEMYIYSESPSSFALHLRLSPEIGC